MAQLPPGFFSGSLPAATIPRIGELSNRETLWMDQVFVVWTSKSGVNRMGLVF